MDKIRNNIKLIIGIFIGIVISCNSIVFAYSFAANEIRHVKSDNSETSVELALNELYQMYDADTIILNKIYPVGSYFITENNSTNPTNLFGGTWVRVEDKVLVAAGSTYTAGTTGGNGTLTYTPAGTNSGGAVSNTTLTLSQIPNFKFRIPHVAFYDSVAISGVSETRSAMTYEGAGSNVSNTGWHNVSVGGGGAHGHGFTQPTFTGTQATLQVMDSLPREVVYVWKRTA